MAGDGNRLNGVFNIHAEDDGVLCAVCVCVCLKDGKMDADALCTCIKYLMQEQEIYSVLAQPMPHSESLK